MNDFFFYHSHLSYSSVYNKDLEKELRGETSGDFAKLVVALLHVIILL